MATATAVSNLSTQSVASKSDGATENGASGNTEASSFEQALLQMLQANLINPAELEQVLAGAELPAGGEDLPSETDLLALLTGDEASGQLSEQVQAVYQSLQEQLSEGRALPAELDESALQQLTASVDELRQRLKNGELTEQQALEQFVTDVAEFAEEITRTSNSANDDESVTSELIVDDVLEANPASESGLVPNAGVEGEELPLSSSELTATGRDVKEAGQGSSDKQAADDRQNQRAADTADEKNSATQAEVDSAAQSSVVSQAQAQSASVSSQGQTGQSTTADSARAIAAAEVRGDSRAASTADANTQQASSNASDTEGGESDADRQPNRAQQFREAMLAQRLDRSGQESPESVRSSISQSFVLPGQSAPEPAARMNTALSGFQQLQQMYSSGSASPVALSVGAQLGAQNWTANLSQRVSWMMNQQVGQAEIRLDPPDLGSLHIRLSVQNDQTSVQFVSPNAQVRDALEQQMPRLREMLEESGLQLENSDVSDQQSSGQQHAGRQPGAGDARFEEGDDVSLSSSLPMTENNLSLVDYYA